jgi:large subunit ribosomal protein L17
MRHRVEGRKFGREKAHRTALFNNLVKSMIISPEGRIETTLAKAKSLRSYVERLITYGKKDSVASRRLAYGILGSRTLVKKLFDEVAPQMQTRTGGYTRVLKTGFRKGDSAPKAIIEFVKVAEEVAEKPTKEAKKAKAARQTKAETKPKAVKQPKEKLEDIKAADLLKEPETKTEEVD